MRTVKTVVHTLTKLMGDAVLDHLGSVKVGITFCSMARIQTAEITYENVAICCSSKRASLE